MIPRYSRPEMTAIWSDETRYRIWFEIEAHAADALAELGVIPKASAQAIWEKGGKAKFDVGRIDAIEREVKHDVIAFLTHLAEFIGEDSRFVHQGLTSSDVLDTTLAVQLSRASDILIKDIDALLAALKKRAYEHKMTPMIGRSHGVHAEPITFGLKLAGHYAEFARARERLVRARAEIASCKISGAVGTFANVAPQVEAHVAKAMGLAVEPISTQIISRDRHAMFFSTLGVVASSLERLATEIRHLQRSEVLEAEEYFSEGQKGSSTMPHKRNPVLSENMVGLARMVRAYAIPAMENVALWHERDISHSSVERFIGPDATITLDFALARAAGVVEKLVVYPERMRFNIDSTQGLVHSGRVLLALTQKGVSREDAYRIVQKHAMRTWHGEGQFLDLLMEDPQVKKALKPAELEGLFDLDYHLRHVDAIFRRVFGEAERIVFAVKGHPLHGPNCRGTIIKALCEDCEKRVHAYVCTCGSFRLLDLPVPPWTPHDCYDEQLQEYIAKKLPISTVVRGKRPVYLQNVRSPATWRPFEGLNQKLSESKRGSPDSRKSRSPRARRSTTAESQRPHREIQSVQAARNQKCNVIGIIRALGVSSKRMRALNELGSLGRKVANLPPIEKLRQLTIIQDGKSYTCIVDKKLVVGVAEGHVVGASLEARTIGSEVCWVASSLTALDV